MAAELKRGMIRDEVTRRAVLAAICFVLGLSTVFMILGATATALSQVLLTQKTLLMQIGGAVIVVFALHMLGVLRIPLLYREARFDAGRVAGSYGGAYVMGLAFAFGWTPCIGPILGAILTWAAMGDTIAQGVSMLGVYALGLGVPFVLAALFIRPFLKLMTRFRRRIALVEKAMGVLLLILGVAFLTGGFANFSFWMLETFPGLANIEALAGESESLSAGLWVALPTAFAAGMLSFLSPCVLPLAPPYLAFLAGASLDQLTGKAAAPAPVRVS